VIGFLSGLSLLTGIVFGLFRRWRLRGLKS
jgi:hypothetical protein